MLEERIAVMNGASKAVPNKKSYSVAEIQQILGISRPTAYNLIRQELFKSIRVGGTIRVMKSSFDGWLDTSM